MAEPHAQIAPGEFRLGDPVAGRFISVGAEATWLDPALRRGHQPRPLARMAEVCGAGSRRALLRMQTWHVREETFRTALGCLTDAIHAEPLSAWFGDGFRASADGQAFNLGGPGAAGGQVNAHYGRDTIVKIYTTITDR
jgi:hypothetical protein